MFLLRYVFPILLLFTGGAFLFINHVAVENMRIDTLSAMFNNGKPLASSKDGGYKDVAFSNFSFGAPGNRDI